MRFFQNKPILIILSMLFNLGCSSSKLNQGLPIIASEKIAEQFAKKLTADFFLAKELSDQIVDISFLLAPSIDINQFRNAKSIVNPSGTKSAKHEFFIAFDGIFPLKSSRSLLSTYESLIDAAICNEGNRLACLLLNNAKSRLAELKIPATLFRQGWPEWRAIDANPIDWADDDQFWEKIAITERTYTLTTDYLYINLQRGWLVEDVFMSNGWYIPQLCRGEISDGDPLNDNNKGSHEGELLPRIPTGIILTKNLTIQGNDGENLVLDLKAVHLSGVAYNSLPISPAHSDPCEQSCLDYDADRHMCLL